MISHGPRKISLFLEGTFDGLGLSHLMDEQRLRKVWHLVVGEKISEIAEIERYLEKRLYVKVSDSNWKMELRFESSPIIQKINKELGQKMVEEIVWM